MTPTLVSAPTPSTTYRGGVLSVPRSVVLAAWGGALAAGTTGLRPALRAVTGADEPHGVSPAPGPVSPLGGAADGAPPGVLASAVASAQDVGALLSALRGTGARVRALLPSPGDPAGLEGPPSFTADAVDAEEAVVVDGGAGGATGGAGTGLVPRVVEFGSALEPGHTVVWQVHPARVGPSAEATTLEGAARGLRTALARATALMEDLDVARWRDDAGDALADVRGGALARDAFPPGASAQAVGAATTAARVLLLVELAGLDEGGALSSGQARARRAVIGDVSSVARAALAAAASSTWSDRP